MATEDDPHPTRLSGADDRITTIHPRVFASFKHWLSKESDRDPLKRRRDALQADAVEWMPQQRLPHLSSRAGKQLESDPNLTAI